MRVKFGIKGLFLISNVLGNYLSNRMKANLATGQLESYSRTLPCRKTFS